MEKAGRRCVTGTCDHPEHADAAIGYDGKLINVGDRVEIHPGTDLWMQGARYGEVIGIVPTKDDRVRVKLDKLPKRTFSGSADTFKRID